MKGCGGAKVDQKVIDSKTYNAMKDSSIQKISSTTKLGQSTPTNMHRSIVWLDEWISSWDT